jgi:hypothetical protein
MFLFHIILRSHSINVAPSGLKKKVNKPIKCLGMSFENEAARRSYFLTQLAHKLQQQDFKNIPGFPNATDEEILALSNPPYYTACPNPWLSDFLEQSVVTDTNYQREAFVTDVTEGKNDPIIMLIHIIPNFLIKQLRAIFYIIPNPVILFLMAFVVLV